MARNLGLEVIAEGVEEGAQAQCCFFGKPVPAEAFAQTWLSAM